MTQAEELLCKTFNCGVGDLPYLYDLKADIEDIIYHIGCTNFNEILRYAFEEKVEELFGENEDMTIAPNYRATEMFIANREKYDKDKIKELEDYMGLEFRDVED